MSEEALTDEQLARKIDIAVSDLDALISTAAARGLDIQYQAIGRQIIGAKPFPYFVFTILREV